MGGWPQLRETRTIRSGKAPGTVVRCSLRDAILSRIPVSIVHFYAHPLPPDRLADGLAQALAVVPVFGGRIRTSGDALEIVCSDDGVPMEFFTVDETLAEAIGRAAMPSSGLASHCEAIKACDGGLPLLTVRITEFSDGGTALCASFHHTIGDMQTYILLMRAWSAAVEDLPSPEVIIVEDREAYLDSVLPAETPGPPSFRVPEGEEAKLLEAEVQGSALANRTVQIYFSAAEVSRLRDGLAAQAGHWLSTNDALAAHLQTCLRELDDYDGDRRIIMPVNLRPRVGLPGSVVGNLIGDIYVTCAPESTAAQFAAQIRSTVENFSASQVTFQADRRAVAEIGPGRLGECIPFAFDPAHRTLTLSNWTRFGLTELTFGGGPPVLVSPATAVSLPWVAWMVEGFHGTGILLTIVVPVRLAGKLRGANGRARLHRFRPEEDELPALATSSRLI
jgi:hypothetical protein